MRELAANLKQQGNNITYHEFANVGHADLYYRRRVP